MRRDRDAFRQLLMVPILCSMPAALLFASADALATPAKPQRSLLRRLDRLLTRLQNPHEQLREHTYLKGNYAPVRREHVDVPVEAVWGRIPRGLDGMLCRNGPNPIHVTKRYHWFDGQGMLHILRFNKGGAFYTNQFVPSARYQVEREQGEDVFPNMGEYDGIWGLAKLMFQPTMVREFVEDLKTCAPPNTACLMYRDKFYCLNEGNVPFECRILPDGRLEAVGYEYFDGVLDYPVSAHPRIDENGDLLFHSYTVNTDALERDGPMKIGRYSSETGGVESYFGPTPGPHISFAHNLLFTEKYMIIYDCSAHFDPRAMFEGGSFFRTNPAYNLRFGVMPKTATGREDATWFDTGGPGGIVHPLNAWEEKDGTIVIWTPLCDDLDLDLDGDGINVFRMVEFTLDPRTGGVTREVVDDSVNVEFSAAPAMGRFTRFGYTAIQDPGTPGEGSFAGFCVWDMSKSRLHASVYYSDDEVGGEPMLIQSDGKVYVGVYLQKGEDTSFVLYDGETTELVTRLKMPHRVPFGFHGLWISGDELRGHFEYHGEQERIKDTVSVASEQTTIQKYM